ncbi:unnamed protein product [Schistosoma margrebowiei]|uniref:Uncharacterized protein n=1 Tax=Schistosoma margrebowiei TaxID=48269 RepID=A0A183M8H4_9TREM|nr:unnamed protein product [Schistosoma margrebowiei]
MVAGDQQLVHSPFVPAGYWSPCAPLVWNPVKAPVIRFSSSHFRKQHPRHEKALVYIFTGIVGSEDILKKIGSNLEVSRGTKSEPSDVITSIANSFNDSLTVISSSNTTSQLSFSSKLLIINLDTLYL